MKIAQVCHRYFPDVGGVEEHVRNISERLARTNDVSVFTTDPSGRLPKEERINNVEVRRFRTWAPNHAYYFSRELRFFLMQNSGDFDILHAHNYHAFPALYVAQAKRGNIQVFTPHFHGTGSTFFRSLLHMPYRFFGKRIFANADKIVCVSNYERCLVLRYFGVDDRKISVVPNAIDIEERTNAMEAGKTCRVILYVGRLEKYKGVQYLVEALSKLGDDKILEIVGKGSYKARLIKTAKALGVENRIRFSQDLSRKEVLRKYREADLFVLLSKYEAYGMTVAEALASNVPCIVARTSALQEWIDNKNCYGIDYEIDTGELARLIERVIGKRVTGIKFYTWDEVTEKLLSVYREALDRQKNRACHSRYKK